MSFVRNILDNFRDVALFSVLGITLWTMTSSISVVYAVDESPLQSEIESPVASTDLEDWAYGKFRIRLGILKTNFTDEKKFYQKLYGEPSKNISFGVDFNILRKYVAAGIGLKIGYFIDQGKAGKTSVSNPTVDDITVDENGKLELTLIPLQLTGTVQFSPFPVKYLTVDGWAGAEFLRFQEVRLVSQSTEQEGESSTAPITNKGTRTSMVTGVALNILLNGLDQASVYSMRSTMGLGAIYLSPFVEVVSELGSGTGVNFDRTNIGISFTFESVR